MKPQALVARLCRLVGLTKPDAILLRTLVRCPRPRLVRAIAWLACASTARIGPAMQLRGIRFVMRGWDDVYTTLQTPPDAQRADEEHPVAGAALMIRLPRLGRGWQRQPLPTLGPVRPEIELAVAWLTATAGCIDHEDCLAVPELGAACFAATATAA